jgi:hypothetical protein
MRHAGMALLILALVGPWARAQDVAVPDGPVPGASTVRPGYVWIEAENCAAETFSTTGGRWTVRKGAGFAGGMHVVANGSPKATDDQAATWTFRTLKPGEFELWARIGWRHWNDHEWRLDDGKWNVSTAVGGNYEFFKVPLVKGVAEVAWITYGKVKLAAGEHKLSVRLRATEKKPRPFQFFDAFCLSRTPFVPMGKYRPDEKVAVNPRKGEPAGAGWWPFQPTYPLGEEPVLDFSFLNEPVGAHGFVDMVDGELVFTDGTPVRFWGTNASYWGGQLIYMEKLDADRFAAHLARLGVNCVRIHVLHNTNSLMDKTRNDTQHMDPLKLDRLDYLIAALGKRNIYVNIDLMYHRTFLAGDGMPPELIRPARRDPRVKYRADWANGAAAHWHPRAIELNLAFYKQFLTRVNPYTKKSLAQSPQMAMVTIQNEQSIFWGTTNMRKGRTAEILDEIHTAWLKKKYGTHAKLAAAWQVEGQPSPLTPDENLDDGLVKVGQVVMRRTRTAEKRAMDQKLFLYDMESGFYQRWIDAMRGWGVKCPIITSNWHGGNTTTRLVLQASTLGGVVDRHTYFTRPESMIKAVGKGVPMTGFDQQAGRAFCISEWNHGTRGGFGAETIPLMATVAAIQGWDSLFHFNATGPTFETSLGGLRTVPQHSVMYPIASMIWRRGDVATGPVVFERRRDPGYQFGWEREARIVSTDPAAKAGEAGGPMPVPPEVLGIGRVQNAYVEKPTGDLYRADLVAKHWDKEAKVVTSAAGDVEWRYGEGWVRLDTPCTQGAFGAIGGRKIACKDVSIQSPNAHATVLVSSLDGKPIAESERLVVAVVGRAAPNALEPGAGPKAPVAPPCLMEPVTGSVTIKTSLMKATAASVTGYKIADAGGATREAGLLYLKLSGTPQVAYYVIE